MTTDEATEIMRAMTGEPAGEQCRAMMELADVWEEAEEMAACEACRSAGKEYYTLTGCTTCSGTGFVSNGNSLRAEALRLLAECGKDFAKPNMGRTLRTPIARGWWDETARRIRVGKAGVMGWRLAALDAYAAADRPTREAWARETRKLAGWVACGECVGRGRYYVDVGGGFSDDTDCPACHGTGLVPPDPTEVQS